MSEGRVYYNEWDKPTAAWLGELGKAGELPAGHVDTRSIRDVHPDDLDGYDQCHFFAGIGGWPLALRWAGLENVPGIWTGSPPCQPFSVAGKGLAQSDERHLAPVWLDLIKECGPQLVFGEQVEAAIRTGWLDDLFDALEGCGYTCGAAVLPACSVGAPHIRKRLFFGAVRLANADGWISGHREEQCGGEHGLFAQGGSNVREGRERAWVESGGMADAASLGRDRRRTSQARNEPEPLKRSDGLRDVGRLAHAYKDGREPGREIRPLRTEHDTEHGGAESGMAHTSCAGWRQAGRDPSCDRKENERRSGDRDCDGSPNDLSFRMVRSHGADPHHGGWSDADWLGCRDGKFRPVESGTQPLAHGLPARVGRLRGYGNAIVPQVATIFIQEFMNSISDITE